MRFASVVDGFLVALESNGWPAAGRERGREPGRVASPGRVEEAEDAAEEVLLRRRDEEVGVEAATPGEAARLVPVAADTPATGGRGR